MLNSSSGITQARVVSLDTIYKEDEVQECPLEPSTCIGPSIQRVTVVHDTKVNERLWHISRLKETSS